MKRNNLFAFLSVVVLASMVLSMLATPLVVGLGDGENFVASDIPALLEHTRRGYKPKNTVLAPDASGHLQPWPVSKPAELLPGLVVYRFNHSMYYANAEQLSEEIRKLAKLGPQPVKWFCLDGAVIGDIERGRACPPRTARAPAPPRGAPRRAWRC